MRRALFACIGMAFVMGLMITPIAAAEANLINLTLDKGNITATCAAAGLLEDNRADVGARSTIIESANISTRSLETAGATINYYQTDQAESWTTAPKARADDILSGTRSTISIVASKVSPDYLHGKRADSTNSSGHATASGNPPNEGRDAAAEACIV